MHVEKFLRECEEKKYLVFRNPAAPYNLNIVGWRNREAVLDHFNDFISVYWYYENRWFEKTWSATTLPGAPWMFRPANSKGAAIVVPGQYLGSHKLGKFRGYSALKQVGPLKVYRDNNLDSAWDMDPNSVEKGLFGIHIHKAGAVEKYVGFYSAGCQVFQNKVDFDEFIDTCQMAAQIWGNRFSYTLLEF